MKLDTLWKRLAVAAAGLVALEAVARLVAPGINVESLTNYLRNGGASWLLRLYDQLGGGGLVRGGVLALGILPFLSAKIFVRLARLVSRPLEALAHYADGRARLSRWTRALAAGLAGVQALGFARFVQGVPGAVAHPGLGFIAQTAVVLTAGSVIAMVIGETALRAVDDDDPHEPQAPALLSEPGPADTLVQRSKVEMPSRGVE